MSRLMSVAYTEEAVVERRKFVTRRKGWWLDKRGRRLLLPGDQLTLCRKVMGRRAGEPLVRLVEVEAVDVQREPLRWLSSLTPGYRAEWAAREMELEGFPDLPSDEFLARYFVDGQGMSESDFVTRIEWRYLEEEPA